jgi:hypothetical protein
MFMMVYRWINGIHVYLKIFFQQDLVCIVIRFKREVNVQMFFS